MSKIIYSKHIPFSMRKWKREKIEKVFAGCSCIMAITEDGQVLQMIDDTEISAQTECWKNIAEISISSLYTGVAIGLTNKGTCMIAKKSVKKICEDKRQDYHRINDIVKSWHDIIEVSVSDAYFALDKFGKVHYVNIDYRHDDYKEVLSWENVAHIFTGQQSSVFGVTKDGKVLCAGYNCVFGPHGNLSYKLQEIKNVVDICAIGTECEEILLAFSDGSVADLNGNTYVIKHDSRWPIFKSNFCIAATKGADECLDFSVFYFPYGKGLRKIKNKPVSSFAVGHTDNTGPFVIALKK